ncbi:MAG TPA: hypothetical protein VEY94_06890 [Patescibacteria group bacterium]|nr:hypothetical protein [Patescibacteria group bacterium]
MGARLQRTLCRRYGALWSYYHGADQAKLLSKPRPETTSVYSWSDRNLAFHYCKTCGCLMHFEAIHLNPPIIVGVNARMMVGLDPARVHLRQIDNGHTGFFWTKSDEPPMPSRHPRMPPPGPDDWR